jgi:hypothetical protein
MNTHNPSSLCRQNPRTSHDETSQFSACAQQDQHTCASSACPKKKANLAIIYFVLSYRNFFPTIIQREQSTHLVAGRLAKDKAKVNVYHAPLVGHHDVAVVPVLEGQ